MKKWAKILLVVGIVWVIGVVTYFLFFCPIYSTTPVCTSEIMDANSGACPNYGLRNHCLESGFFIVGLLILGIPSWIMFLVVAIWGRG